MREGTGGVRELYESTRASRDDEFDVGRLIASIVDGIHSPDLTWDGRELWFVTESAYVVNVLTRECL